MNRNIFSYGRMLVGVLLKDLMRYCSKLKALYASYLSICNRQESLEPSPDGSGYCCAWQWTSELHAPKVLPFLGRWLMKRALADHPIRCLPQPELVSEQPEVSFIIGHRGRERLPHLLATLESIAGQEGTRVECLVVEQDVQAHLLGHLPAWVRYLHTPPPTPNLPYCRAWAFNAGVRQAHGPILVLHDNDMLVPADYAARILQHVRLGYEALNLKRFVFYLSEVHSRDVFAGITRLTERAPEIIVQNLEAGGSIAITREGYKRIGGFDEAFVGWGGEDNEFWERARTLKVWPYGYFPLVHLWHPSQPDKFKSSAAGQQRFYQLTRIPPETRIRTLRNRPQGQMNGPCRTDARI